VLDGGIVCKPCMPIQGGRRGRRWYLWPCVLPRWSCLACMLLTTNHLTSTQLAHGGCCQSRPGIIDPRFAIFRYSRRIHDTNQLLVYITSKHICGAEKKAKNGTGHGEKKIQRVLGVGRYEMSTRKERNETKVKIRSGAMIVASSCVRMTGAEPIEHVCSSSCSFGK
jgi:hypothetical protein